MAEIEKPTWEDWADYWLSCLLWGYILGNVILGGGVR